MQMRYHQIYFTWTIWMKNIVPSWSLRQKWWKEGDAVVEGDIVLLLEKDDRKRWPMGRVIEVIKGKDGLVRVVKVLVDGKEVTRDVRRLSKVGLVDDLVSHGRGNGTRAFSTVK